MQDEEPTILRDSGDGMELVQWPDGTVGLHWTEDFVDEFYDGDIGQYLKKEYAFERPATPEAQINLMNQTLMEIIAVNHALDGDVDTARKLAACCAWYLVKDVPLTPLLKDYLICGLVEVSEGEDAGIAFCVKRGRGRPKLPSFFRLALDALYWHEVALRMEEGMTFEDATFEVAENFGVSDETIKAAYMRHLSDD